eukprot:164079_1
MDHLDPRDRHFSGFSDISCQTEFTDSSEKPVDPRERNISDISCESFEESVDPFPRASVTAICNICGHLQLYSIEAGINCRNCTAGTMVANTHTRFLMPRR